MRGQQRSGLEQADVVGLEGIFIEVKRVESIHINSDALRKALEKANEESKNDIPVVFHRQNRKPWKCSMYLHDMAYRRLKEGIMVTLSLEDWLKWYKRHK